MQEQISLDDLRNKLKERMLVEKEEAIQSFIRKQILENLADKIDFPIPECLIEEKINQMVDNVANYLRERGVDFEKTGITEERLRTRYREEAKFLVKCEVIMDKIADKEDIDISKEKINEYISQQEGLEGLDKNQLAAALKFNVLPKLFAREVLDFIIKNAHIKK
jgi:trigger factor